LESHPDERQGKIRHASWVTFPVMVPNESSLCCTKSLIDRATLLEMAIEENHQLGGGRIGDWPE
jgi:hypothetical protein